MIREALRTLNLTGWLIVTVLILTPALMGWCSLDAGRSKRNDINTAHAGQVVAEANQSTAIVASKASETAAEAARASQAITDRNHAEILSTPGANASVGAVSDAGLRSLCKRAVYANDPRCRSMRASGA